MGYPALIYEVSPEKIQEGRDGFERDGKKYSGWIQLIEDYIWHKKTGMWDAPREIIEKDYKILIN